LLRDFTTDLTADFALVRVTDPVFAEDLTVRESALPAADFAALLDLGLVKTLAAVLAAFFVVALVLVAMLTLRIYIP
jgi:hypothetical protein